jgi:phosphomannomutase
MVIMSSLMVSSSGIRGIVGDSLTPEIALKVATSFGKFIGSGTVILGGDTRVSHEMVLNIVQGALLSVGISVINIGKVTTPTVQQMIGLHNADGGIVITASHNPIMWNGIKLMNRSGSFLTKDEFATFLSHYQSSTCSYSSWDKVGELNYDHQALEKHIDLILSKIDVSIIKNSGLKVLIDANNGAGAVANPLLLKKLGVHYEIINGEPSGRFTHDPEPLKQNLSQIMSQMKNGQYDIGFIQDADADRLVILDETGHFIGEDYSLALCIDQVLRDECQHETNKQVVVNLSTSNVIKDIAILHGATFYQTAIGEPNVTAKLKEVQATVGGEGNGGIIFPKIGWGRDSLVGIVLALKYLATSKKKVSELVSQYPKYTMLKEKFEAGSTEDVQRFLTKVEEKFKQESLDKSDGIKVMFQTGWIHVRPSNTEPIVRIFTEEQSIEKAQALMNLVLAL